jgi:5-hydroxyisourate hydrolase
VTLTTHVLDTARGRPAAGITIAVYALDGESRQLVASAETNDDGRTAAPLATGITPGSYDVVFSVGAYFERFGTPAFYDQIAVRVLLAAGERSYHVPLMLAPWSYTTYRGS